MLFEFFKDTVRRDIRKRINKYFKEIGVKELSDEVSSSFLKLNEVLSPIDNISVALRRKWALRSEHKMPMPVVVK